MNWKVLFCCLFLAIEAFCMRRTVHMWQQEPPTVGITSCNPPSLLALDATSIATERPAATTATTEIKTAASVAGKVITGPSAFVLGDYIYQCASLQDNLQDRMSSSCSKQPPKSEPESKPESLYPEWEWELELKQHGPEPEVTKPRTVTLSASELEMGRQRWSGHLSEIKPTPMRECHVARQ